MCVALWHTADSSAVILAQGSAATSVGLVRSVNEDLWYAGERLFLVADGMGGHAAGDVASRIAVEFLAKLDREDVQSADVDAAVISANSAILDHAGRHPEAAGMGTTVCGLVRGRYNWLVFNVGDSRCYELARGTLRQVTVDHSEVQELVDLGHISREEARVHPYRNVVTRALGQVPPPVVDYLTLPVGRGARYVLASDGLSSELTDTAIARLCADPSPADELQAVTTTSPSLSWTILRSPLNRMTSEAPAGGQPQCPVNSSSARWPNERIPPLFGGFHGGYAIGLCQGRPGSAARPPPVRRACHASMGSHRRRRVSG